MLYQAWERQRCVESEKGMMEQKRLGNTEPNAVVELVKTLNNFNWKQAFIWSLENNNFVFLQSAVAEFAKKFKLYAFQEKIEFNAYIFHHEKLQIKQNNIQVLWLHISGIADLVCVSEAHTQSSAITCFFVLLLTFFQLFSERSCSSIKLNLRSSLWDIHIDKVKVCNEQATLNALLFLPNSNIAAMKYSKEKHLGLFSYDTFIVNLSTCFNHFESKVQE